MLSMTVLRKILLSSICIVSALTIGTNYFKLDGQSQVLPQPPATESPSLDTVEAPGQVLTEVALYFGLSKPGGNVSEAEWQAFLDREITPRFKDGFTVLNAYGQYQNSSGELVQENTKLVILIYQNSSEKEAHIEAIIDVYKQTFQQESVLRTTGLVKAAF
jgi:hypothetical protein